MTGLAGIALLLDVVAAILFVLSLRLMAGVRTARLGNLAGVAGMALAAVATLLAVPVGRVDLLVAGVALGALLGTPIGLRVGMTAVPQRTAFSHAFGSLAVALVGCAEFLQGGGALDPASHTVLDAEMILGFLTVSGSLVAFAKLQGLVSGAPFLYRGQRAVTFATLAAALVAGGVLVARPDIAALLPVLALLALLFGLQLVVAIGGADMPAVIAILNSFAGLSAAALGFVLDSKLLIVAGALDGSSGLVLGLVMSKAMNRSFASILLGGVGVAKGAAGAAPARSVASYTADDVATVLAAARNVVVAPGYGMAVAQAQHVVKELADALQARGIDVKYAIHPVAGRMPGHMNVLLAEARVPYEQLWEMERINPLFPETDVVLVVGANDVTNPASRTKVDSPLYGMPILDVDKAKTVVCIKRSLAAGFSGVENELFYLPGTMMVLGDAKKVVGELVAALAKTR